MGLILYICCTITAIIIGSENYMSIIRRLTFVVVIVIIGLAPKAMAQDLGAPDTLYLLPSELDVSGNDSLFTLELWVFNDSNEISLDFHFGWISDLLTLDSARFSDEARNTWFIGMFYDGTIEMSNANNRALCVAYNDWSQVGLPAATNRQLVATYYFSVSDWTVHSEIIVNSSYWNNEWEMIMWQPTGYEYVPVWYLGDEMVVVRDVNGNPNGSCCGWFTDGQTGNINCDVEGERNLADITALIDRIFLTKTALCCEANGNVDGDLDAKMNLSDITRLIDHIFLTKAETAACE